MKFLLDSMDNFILESRVVNGDIEVWVGLDFNTIEQGNYIWSASSAGGFASLSVKSTDKNFHMATWYYIVVKAVSARDAIINIELMQKKSVEFIPNNHDFTF